MKCWNSAFITWFKGKYSTCTGQSSENMFSNRKKEKTWQNSIYPKNLWKNSFGFQVFFFVKFSFTITHLTAYYAKIWPISPLHWETLGITLICSQSFPLSRFVERGQTRANERRHTLFVGELVEFFDPCCRTKKALDEENCLPLIP